MANDHFIEVDEKHIPMMLLTGFAQRGEDGVVEISPKGEAWLQEWCDKKIAEHEAIQARIDDAEIEYRRTL